MAPGDLDDLLDRELHRLPGPAAPPTLLPRVMEAVGARARAPWYCRPWITWPAGWQVASALAIVVVAFVLALPGARETAGDFLLAVDAHVPAPAAGLVNIWRQMAALMRVFWEFLLAPAAAYVGLLVLAGSLGCAAFWTALNRLALGGAPHR